MLTRLFRPRPAKAAGEALYAAAAAQARAPVFYTALAAPDTREGRYELYSLHVILLMDRLKGQGDQAAETAQILVDRFVRGLDDAFRELGVGDTAVPKRVKKLAEAFYGRLRACEAAFATLPDRSGLESLLARTVYDGLDADPSRLAGYVADARDLLSRQPLERLLAGEITWEAPR